MPKLPNPRAAAASKFEQESADHQTLLAKLGVRTSQGAFYTPLDVAERLADTALRDAIKRMRRPEDSPRVLDATCGTGSFLVAAALRISDRLVELGMSQVDALKYAVSNCLFGTDIDTTAAEICRHNLAALSLKPSCVVDLSEHILAVDSLRLFLLGGGRAGQGSLFDEPERTWADTFPEVFSGEDPGFDAVIGNPPFLNQLESETSLSTDLATALVDRYGESLSKLTNTASIFMLGASEIVKVSGVVTLIQPISFLATRESNEIRRLLLQRRSLQELWFGGGGIFDAAVEVVGVTLGPKQSSGSTQISIGRNFNDGGHVDSPSANDKTWSRPLARAKGVPKCVFTSDGVVGDFAEATADFRDQYYGLVGAVRDLRDSENQSGLLRLATVGLIDLARFMWGERPTKFAKDNFTRPVVDPKVLPEKLRSWALARAVPKVIVSNQTKILEVYVDVAGDILPSVPLLTVDCEIKQLWLVAAAIASPVATIVAAERHLGAGMSVDVLKLSAKDVLSLPVPTHNEAWSEGAEILKQLQGCKDQANRTVLLSTFASEMNSAFGVSDSGVVDWWLSRFPKR
jgi:methylase of polypeptide subunit release factors